MIICVASGKGGTGKTTVAVSLAEIMQDSAYVDADVEEPNGHLFLNPTFETESDVHRLVAKVDTEACTWCTKCVDACAFNAILIAPATKRALVFEDLCTGCGVCAYVCGDNAILEEQRLAGVVSDGVSGATVVREGRMDIDAPHASPVLHATLTDLPAEPVVILDSEPGVTGRVIEIAREADVCLLVAEPTPFGMHDLELALKMTKHIGVPAAVLINRSDIGDLSVRKFCAEANVPVLLEIPFDRRIAAGSAVGRTLVDIRPDMREPLVRVGDDLRKLADGRDVQ